MFSPQDRLYYSFKKTIEAEAECDQFQVPKTQGCFLIPVDSISEAETLVQEGGPSVQRKIKMSKSPISLSRCLYPAFLPQLEHETEYNIVPFSILSSQPACEVG